MDLGLRVRAPWFRRSEGWARFARELAAEVQTSVSAGADATTDDAVASLADSFRGHRNGSRRRTRVSNGLCRATADDFAACTSCRQRRRPPMAPPPSSPPHSTEQASTQPVSSIVLSRRPAPSPEAVWAGPLRRRGRPPPFPSPRSQVHSPPSPTESLPTPRRRTSGDVLAPGPFRRRLEDVHGTRSIQEFLRPTSPWGAGDPRDSVGGSVPARTGRTSPARSCSWTLPCAEPCYPNCLVIAPGPLRHRLRDARIRRRPVEAVIEVPPLFDPGELFS